MTVAAAVDQYVALEQRIDGAESDGIMARWEFGRALLTERVGKKLPVGRLDEVARATGAGRRELQFRLRFAEQYPDENALRSVVRNHKSWTAIREQALPARDTPGDPPEPISPATGTFSVVVIDPPWQYDNKATRGAAEDHYDTMSMDELRVLDVPAADNAHLYLWVTNGMMREGFELCEAWGFQYKALLTWVKPQIGLGNYFRNATEHVIFGLRGKLPTNGADIPTWFKADRTRHSQKPDSFYDLVEKASPGPYLEMFARRRRFGWDVWGNEA